MLKVTAYLQTESPQEESILTAGKSYIQDLAKVENLTITIEEKPEPVPEKTPLRGLKLIGGVILAIALCKLSLVVLDTVNQSVIIGKSFELVGLLYTIWFVTRNLINAKARQKFWANLLQPPKTGEKVSPTEPQLSPDSENTIAGVIGTVQVLIPLKGVVDIEGLRAKLEKSISKAEAEAQSLSARLNNASFVDKAPTNVVQGVRDALAEAEKQAEILRDRLRALV